MKVSTTEMINVDISHKEIEDLVMEYIYRKHDLNSAKWNLEEFYIDWKPNGDPEKPCVSVMFIRSNPVEGLYRDSKCSGSCGRCSNSHSCR